MHKTLTARDCYVGQRVFWVMWSDPKDAAEKRTGWYCYKSGFTPEIWWAPVERLPGGGHIMLEHYGKATCIYACEIDAIRDAYWKFCNFDLSDDVLRGTSRSEIPLSEAVRVLTALQELEDGVHEWIGRRLPDGVPIA